MATMLNGATGVDEYKPWWDGLYSNASSLGGAIGGTGAVVAGLGAVVGGLIQNWTSQQKREYLANQLAQQAKNGDKKAQHLYEQMTGTQVLDMPTWITGATGKRGVLENIWPGTQAGELGAHTGTIEGQQTAVPETGTLDVRPEVINPHAGTLAGQQTAVPETGTLDVRPEILNPQAGTIDISQWITGATGKRGVVTGNNTTTQVLDIPGLANLGKGVQSGTTARPIETPAHYVPASQKMKWLLEAKNALDIGLRTDTGTGTGTGTGTATGDLYIPGLAELGKGLRNGQDVIDKPIETPAHVVPSAKNLQLLLQREGIELGGLPDPEPIPKPEPVPIPTPIPIPPDPVPPVPDPIPPVPDPIPPNPSEDENENNNGENNDGGNNNSGYISPFPDGGESFIDFWGGNNDNNNTSNGNNENQEGEYDMDSINWLKWLDEQQKKQWEREDAIRAETQAREDSAYQRAVKDMYKAGINPNLMNVQPASAGGGITNATGKNTGVLEAQLSNDTKLLEQMIEQAFKGDENAKDRFTGILGDLIQSIVTAMIFKG